MTHHPSHQFCPKCNALLPPDLEKCPQCNARLKVESEPEMTLRQKLQLALLFGLGAAVPLCILIGMLLMCYLTLIAT